PLRPPYFPFILSSLLLLLSLSFFQCSGAPPDLPSFPTRRSSDLLAMRSASAASGSSLPFSSSSSRCTSRMKWWKCTRRLRTSGRSEEHTSELQSLTNLVCRLLLEKKKQAGHVITS